MDSLATLSFAGSLALLGLVIVLPLRMRLRRVLGDVWFSRRQPGALGRGLLLGLIVLAILGGVQGMEFFLRSLPALLGAAALVLVQPWPDDEALGSEGVVRGWSGTRYEDLEEWRLTGDHLRYRLRGEWASSGFPVERADALREQLERVAGDRESPYRH